MKFHSCPVVAQAAEEKLGQLPCQILFSPHITHLAVFCAPILISFHLPKFLLWRCHNVNYECIDTVIHIVD